MLASAVLSQLQVLRKKVYTQHDVGHVLDETYPCMLRWSTLSRWDVMARGTLDCMDVIGIALLSRRDVLSLILSTKHQ